MSVHYISIKGKRPQNEDKHNTIINMDGSAYPNKAKINYYAVYDGHGGKFVSKFLHDNLPQCFIDNRVKYPLKKDFVKEVYNYWQNTLKTNYLKNSINTGSTCLVAIHYKTPDGSNYINVLNTGDSRCIISSNNIGIPITKDHKPNWPEETKRIEALGGRIVFDGFDYRISDLSVSRAFGDVSAEPYLTCMPDIYKRKLTSDDQFMVLACDGLWDVLGTQDVVNYVIKRSFDQKTGQRINKHINVAKELAKLALDNGSTDNVTAIVVFFK